MKLEEIYSEFGLTKSDIHYQKFGSTTIPSIKRVGIEKIQAKLNIEVKYDVVVLERDWVVMKAVGQIKAVESQDMKYAGSTIIQTFGEANPQNNKMKNYPVAMAEKRALSRVVLKLAGLYKHGYYGEDEFDNAPANEVVEPDIKELIKLMQTKSEEVRTKVKAEIKEAKTVGCYTQDFIDRLIKENA